MFHHIFQLLPSFTSRRNFYCVWEPTQAQASCSSVPVLSLCIPAWLATIQNALSSSACISAVWIHHTLSLCLYVILHFFSPTTFQFVAKCIFVKLKPVSGEKGIRELQPFAPGVLDVSLVASSKLKVCVKKLNLNNLFLESFRQLCCASLNHGLHTSSFPRLFYPLIKFSRWEPSSLLCYV